jgi:hypothetical protein
MYGYLLLHRGLLVWERWFYQLDEAEGTLAVSKSPTSPPQHVLLLSFFTVKAVKPGSKRFRLSSLRREYLLKASSPSICLDWVASAERAIKVIRADEGPRRSSVLFYENVVVRTYDSDLDLSGSFSSEGQLSLEQRVARHLSSLASPVEAPNAPSPLHEDPDLEASIRPSENSTELTLDTSPKEIALEDNIAVI